MATAPRMLVCCRLAALALTCVAQATLESSSAAAQPPSLSFVHAAAVAAYAASIAQPTAQPAAKSHDAQRDPRPAQRQGAQPQPSPAPPTAAPQNTVTTQAAKQPAADARGNGQRPATRAPIAPKQPPPLPSALERLGGQHAKRAMQVAQGVPAGRVALRPMFWMTRDQRGGMVALGGRF